MVKATPHTHAHTPLKKISIPEMRGGNARQERLILLPGLFFVCVCERELFGLERTSEYRDTGLHLVQRHFDARRFKVISASLGGRSAPKNRLRVRPGRRAEDGGAAQPSRREDGTRI